MVQSIMARCCSLGWVPSVKVCSWTQFACSPVIHILFSVLFCISIGILDSDFALMMGLFWSVHVYPQHEWLLWKFDTSPMSYWTQPGNRAHFIKWFASLSGFSSLDRWYSVDLESIRREGGGGLLAIYNDSLFRLLQEVYPDHEWLPWKFKKLPSSIWSLSKGLTPAQARQFVSRS